MVGRLVEHEEIGLHHEQARQMRAHDPAAAHGLGGAIEIGFAKSQAAEDALRLRLVLVTTELRVPAERVVIFLRVSLSRAGAFGEDAHELAVLLGDGAGEFQHRFVAAGRRFLRQIPDGSVLIDDDGPGVGLAGAQDNGEESRFARAVRADQRDPLPEIDTQGNVFKERARAVAFADFGQGKHKRSMIREAEVSGKLRRCAPGGRAI